MERFEEHITVKTPRLPQAALMLLLPVEGIGIVAFLAYLYTHWTLFVAQSVSMFAWLGWVTGIVAYILIAALVVKVLRAAFSSFVMLGHGIAEMQGKFTDNKIAYARKSLLHTADNYVVYLEGGKITVQPIVSQAASMRIAETGNQMQISEQTIDALPSPIRSFKELLASGIIQKALADGKMVLGYLNGVLRYGSWLDLYSCGVGGVSGSGKSTTVRFLLFQALLAGAKLVMIDPHIEEKEESLAAQFKAFKDIHALSPCAESEKEVAKRVKYLKKEYLRRKTLGIKGPPLVFVLDEFNEIIRVLSDELRKELADLLLTISQAGRKFGMFAMLIAQRWSENDLGGKNYGAAIRSSLAGILAHRLTSEDQARLLIGSKHGAKCLELGQGHYWFRDTSGGIEEMVTPLTLESDGEIIQSLLDETSMKAPEYTHVAREQEQANASTEPLQISAYSLELTPESSLESTKLVEIARQVIQMQAEGLQKAEIMRKVWGVNPGGTEEYKRAVAEYQNIMQFVASQI